jgi:hypothetical protein
MGRKGGYVGEKQIIYRSLRSEGDVVKERIGHVRGRLSSPVQDLATPHLAIRSSNPKRNVLTGPLK